MSREARSRGVQFGAVNTREGVTIAEAFEQAGANYEVQKQNLVRLPNDLIEKIMNGEELGVIDPSHIITSSMATYRTDTDTTLGVVGSKYGICQNAKALEFIDFMTNGSLTDGKPIVETCGVLDNGGRVWVSVKMPSQSYLSDKDNIEEYLLFSNTHDGSGAVNCIFTPIRVVCNNTLAAALRLSGKQNIGKLVFKHTSGINERMDFTADANRAKAVEALQLYTRCKDEYINNLLGLKTQTLGNTVSEIDKKVLEFATRLNVKDEKMVAEVLKMGSVDNIDIATRTKNNINALMDSIYGGIGQEDYKGTALWLANGITTYYQNDYKGTESEEDRLISINFDGTASKAVEKAFDLLPRLVA